jgi:hypothetical protein
VVRVQQLVVTELASGFPLVDREGPTGIDFALGPEVLQKLDEIAFHASGFGSCQERSSCVGCNLNSLKLLCSGAALPMNDEGADIVCNREVKQAEWKLGHQSERIHVTLQ